MKIMHAVINTSSAKPLQCTASLLFLLMLAGVAPAAAQERPLSYDLTYDFNGQRTYQYAVLQGPELTLVEEIEEGATPSFTLETATAVAGPALGHAPATLGGTVRQTTLLEPYFDGPDAFQPGRTEESESFGEVKILTVDSLQHTLTRGTRDSTIAGHKVQHYLLEAALFQHTDNADGEQVSDGAERTRQDLWFAPDLPFSAAPLAVLKRAGAFLPLGSGRADAAVWHGLKDRLRERGLLVRAEQHRFQKGFSTRTHYFTVQARNIRPAEAAPPPLGEHFMYTSRSEAMEAQEFLDISFALFRKATQGNAPATFTGAVAGTGYERSLRGPAVFTPSTEGRSPFKAFTMFLPAGEGVSQDGPSENDLLGGVVLVGTKKGLPEPGTYALTALDGEEEEPSTDAQSSRPFHIGAALLRMDGQSPSEVGTFTRVSGGTLTIEKAGPQQVQGQLEATLSGYALPGHTGLLEVRVTGTFEATPGLAP